MPFRVAKDCNSTLTRSGTGSRGWRSIPDRPFLHVLQIERHVQERACEHCCTVRLHRAAALHRSHRWDATILPVRDSFDYGTYWALLGAVGRTHRIVPFSDFRRGAEPEAPFCIL